MPRRWTERGPMLLAVGWALLLTPESPAIKNRPPREARAVPAAVLITATNTTTRKTSPCSGVWIAPRAVLTAAHCVAGFDSWQVTAPYAQNGRLHATSRNALAHPQFKLGHFEYDLAVIILDEPLDLGFEPPRLRAGALHPIETPLIVVGRVANGMSAQDQLYEASVTLVAFPGNVNVYGGHPQVTEPGDSGGPVVVARQQKELAALISGYIPFSRANVPTDLLVPIDRLKRAWILQQVPKE
ncbi:MAG: trypsin-like serine protease [Gemmataceae bacterium]